jgi:ferredoxin
VAQLLEALRYKQEGRGFDSRKGCRCLCCVYVVQEGRKAQPGQSAKRSTAKAQRENKRIPDGVTEILQ